MKKRVLVLEPYFGGSHKQFLLGLRDNIDAEFIFLTLPARKWKMKMQLSALWFVECISNFENKYFDTVLCSTFVDVAVLKALLTQVNEWNHDSIICTYYHENQFVYPLQKDDKSNRIFSNINFTTAMASDRLAFNSEFNWRTFYENSSRYVKKISDMDLSHSLLQIKKKKKILYPGLEFTEGKATEKKLNSVPIICWNHRWEHDKDPERFFKALLELEENGIDFNLILMGQSFRGIHPAFTKARDHFGNKILHFGYVKSRKEYISFLQQSDIIVSTARHEFFGYSVVEAVRYGCIPLVPDCLAYPELYPEKFRYTKGNLTRRLSSYLQRLGSKKRIECDIDTERFSWKKLGKSYNDWLFAV